MADNETNIKINLDTKEAVKGAIKLKDAIAQVGESEGLGSLVKGLLSLGPYAAAAAAAIYVLKKAVDAVFEGEQINKINKQFEILAGNVGISADALRNDLGNAAKGLIDDTDLIKAANKAIVEMGENAQNLGVVLGDARKIASVMGKDTTEVFEQLNTAIAMGNVRALRSVGIFLDQNKVLDEYAKAHGTVAAALSKEAQQAAVLEAVNKKVSSAYGDQVTTTNSLSASWQKLKVLANDLWESIAVSLNKTLGPALKSLIDMTGKLFGLLSDYGQAVFGEGEKASKGAIGLASRTSSVLKALRLDYFGFVKKWTDETDNLVEQSNSKEVSAANNTAAQLKEINKKKIEDEEKMKPLRAQLLNQLIAMDQEYLQRKQALAITSAQELMNLEEQTELTKAQFKAKRAAIEADKTLLDKQAVLAKLADNEVLAMEQLELQKAQIKQKYAEQDLQQATTLQQVDTANKQLQLATEAEFQARKEEIKSSTFLTEQQRMEQIQQLDDQYTQRKLDNEKKLQDYKIAALQRQADQAKTTQEGIAAGWELSSQRAIKANNNYGAQGQRMFDSFGKNATEAFTAVGEGSKNAGEAAKGFAFGVIGDEAQARGQLLLLQGLGTFNFGMMAAGGALLTFGGFLKSQAKGGGGTNMPAVGGTMSTGGGAPQRLDDSGMAPEVKQHEQQKKTVSINIQGSYYDTNETRQRLTEMIRESSDATDFNIKQAGGGF